MLSYNDQQIREAHNEQICRELYEVSQKHNAVKAAFAPAKEDDGYNPPRQKMRVSAIGRVILLMVVIVLSLWLTVQVAVAAEVYGAEVMGNEVYGAEVMGNEVYGAEVMGNEVYGAEVMGNEVMGGETGESSNWLPRLLMALGLASSAGAPSGVNYY